MALSTSDGKSMASCLPMVALLLGVALHAQTPANPDDVDRHFQVPPILKIGAQAPDFDLPGIDGKSHILKEYASSKVLVIVFTCNHCPIAQMYEERIKKLASDFHDRGVAVVAIMPNDPRALQVSELRHSDMSDTLAEMKIRAAYRRFNFPYLYDGATQSVALMYGPTATPHVFIFDEQRKLRYQGRIDSNPREEHATKHEARDAIEDLLADRRITAENTPTVGCSTKWAYKEANAAQEVTEIEHEPVHLEMAGVDRMKELRKNGTKKFVLVNFWATWCEPCVKEFSELQKTYRMYWQRPFEVVTVSVNAPDEKQAVLKFLNEQHGTTRNYLFSVTDPADAIAAFGTGWSGGVPYTVLLSPEGQVLYKNQGEINPLEVRRVILKNLPEDNFIGAHAYWNHSF